MRQRLKPLSFSTLNGTAEAVPYKDERSYRLGEALT